MKPNLTSLYNRKGVHDFEEYFSQAVKLAVNLFSFSWQEYELLIRMT